MKRITLFSILLILSFLVTACSTSVDDSLSAVKRNVNEISQMAEEEFKKKAADKGLTETMVHTLENLGYVGQDILNLSSEKIAEIFAPGANKDGAPSFMPDDKQLEELKKVHIDDKMSSILGNLGYTFDEMLRLTPNELDLIFPNTELIAKLSQKGFNEQEIQSWFDKGESYKEIIKEALKQ